MLLCPTYLTPTKYRPDYTLYEDKPCLDEDEGKCRGCLEARIRSTGDEIGYGEWGDSIHFNVRTAAAGHVAAVRASYNGLR